MGFSMFGFLLPVALMFNLLVSSAPRHIINSLVGQDTAQALVSVMVCYMWSFHCWVEVTAYWVVVLNSSRA